MAEIKPLLVANDSKPAKLAGAICNQIKEHGASRTRSVGAGSVNQAVKAIAIARGYMAPSGIDLVCTPSFLDVEIEGETRTSINFLIENRSTRY
jgi:stage V sporulation protein S